MAIVIKQLCVASWPIYMIDKEVFFANQSICDLSFRPNPDFIGGNPMRFYISNLLLVSSELAFRAESI